MPLGIEEATNDKEECMRLRLFWCLFFPCCGPVTAPVIRLFFFREMPILWAFRPSSDHISCSLQGRGEKRSRYKRQLHFRKLESRKRPLTCSRSTPKRTRGFIRYGGCKATITQLKSAFCQNEANG
jgi:hypothetical protein